MSLNKTKIKEGGETGQVIEKESRVNLLKKKFNGLSTQRKIVAILVMAVGLLLFISIVAYIYGVIVSYDGSKKEAKYQASAQSVCNNDIVSRAAVNLAPDKSAELGKVNNIIAAMQGYENDPNCLIPIVIYHVNTGNLDEADKAYNKITNFAPDSYSVNGSYSAYGILTVKDVQTYVDGLRKAVDEAQQNTRYF